MLEGRLTRSYFPKDDAVAKDICFFRVFLAGNYLRGHPLIRSNLSCHVVIESLGPSEICNFDAAALIQEQIEALEVSVKNGRGAGMQIMDSTSSLESEPLPLIPAQR